jgi:hypothetical protein
MVCETSPTAVDRRFPNALHVRAAEPPVQRQLDLVYEIAQIDASPEDNLVRFDFPASRALVTFKEAQHRLLAYVRNRIRNGDFTERALARQIGISQPHVHNGLKGVRTLSPEILDTILRHFRLSLSDLLSRPIEWNGQADDTPRVGLFLATKPQYTSLDELG